MRKSADVVIIGGGIQGTSVAYHLAKKGIRDTVLVEMDTLGSGSSGLSAAMLMHQTGQEQTTKLALISIKEYRSYSKKFEIDISFRKTGSICFATEPQKADELRKRIEMQNRIGIATETLDGSGVSKLAPLIKEDGIIVATYCEQDGYIDPYSVVNAYAQEARKLGVEINLRVKALNIKTSGRKVVGVETKGVETGSAYIETPVVINAAGALAGQVAEWVGIHLPIMNKKRNIVFLAPRPPLEPFPIVEDVVTEWYLRPDGKNIMVGVGPQEEVGYIPDTLRPGFDESCLYKLGEYIEHRAPALMETAVMGSHWAGVRCMTSDELPILGPVDGVEGFLNCCGWSGFGITLAPVGGMLLAEFVAHGKSSTAEINPFLLKRFQGK